MQPDIAERALGHVIAGVAGAYDRLAYLDGEREALKELADVIELLLVS